MRRAVLVSSARPPMTAACSAAVATALGAAARYGGPAWNSVRAGRSDRATFSGTRRRRRACFFVIVAFHLHRALVWMQRSDVVLLAAWKRGRFFEPFRPHA